jgi:hypothetical protein
MPLSTTSPHPPGVVMEVRPLKRPKLPAEGNPTVIARRILNVPATWQAMHLWLPPVATSGTIDTKVGDKKAGSRQTN